MFTETELFERLYQGASGHTLPHLLTHDAAGSQLLVSLFEEAYLLDIALSKAIFIHAFHGEPACGIIGGNGRWAAVGGANGLAVRHLDIVRHFDGISIYGMRSSGPDSLLILEDPWVPGASLWEFNVATSVLVKVRPFPDYAGKPYSGNVIW